MYEMILNLKHQVPHNFSFVLFYILDERSFSPFKPSLSTFTCFINSPLIARFHAVDVLRDTGLFLSKIQVSKQKYSLFKVISSFLHQRLSIIAYILSLI